MSSQSIHKRFIISGGGTGGHIFPAISIAFALRALEPTAEILFVGARGKMEMQKVAEAGFSIVGLPVSGFHRKHTLKNLLVLYRLAISLLIAKKIIKQFQPHVAVGVGGYVSAPVLRMAASEGIPTLIQEQNSFAGMTNRWLAARAKRICVAYPGMEKYFPADRILLTGNPIRKEIEQNTFSREEGLRFFNLDPARKTLLVLGGSLGAGSINRSISVFLRQIPSQVQVIWQTGENYYEALREQIPAASHIFLTAFIRRMDLAYAAADLIVSRAGAGTISELCVVGKACVLIPSPNVAEDHQTHNAHVLAERGAACLVRDVEADRVLPGIITELMGKDDLRFSMGEKIRTLAQYRSAERIAHEVIQLIKS